MTGSRLAPTLCWLYGLLLVLMMAYAVVFNPIAYGDQFAEIVRTFKSGIVEILELYLSVSYVYFRPLEYVWREVLFILFGERLFAYNLFQILLLGIIAAAFLALCRVRSGRDGVAALLALSCLLGHHAFTASLEMNYVISNLVIVAIQLLALMIIRSGGGLLAAVAAAALTLVALLTKENGIVVPAIFFLAWWLGFRGVRLSSALLVGSITALYLGYRAYVVVWSGEIGHPSYAEEEGSLAIYLANAGAALINIVLSEPKLGNFSASLAELATTWRAPWKLAQILAPLLTFALIAFVAVTNGVWRTSGDRELRRWLILLAATVVLSALLGFYNPRDYSGVTALPVLALTFWLCLRQVMSEIESERLARGLRLGLVCLLVLLSASWTLRVAGNFFYLRQVGAAIQAQWVTRQGEYQASVADDGQVYLDRFYNTALGTPVATIREDGRWVLLLFGDRSPVQ